ncbi:hypothetical protein AK812_SmicGene8549 [Symbiodinium microadriaticum]|uniref:Uncharacterized protein n=1 Tax=Symbiodinium microadriaticum TaxID=2951 RepID=A0A1Q9EKJ5_SYMMI|nr:hypothetical protein AK812_SmicGene8549 [Symbiodinium microadriaticum]
MIRAPFFLFARLHLAARALFSPEQLQALEVGTVADSLMRGVPQFALEGPAATSPERIPEPTEPRYEAGKQFGRGDMKAWLSPNTSAKQVGNVVHMVVGPTYPDLSAILERS